MAENELEIVLSLVDKASAELKKAMGGVTAETNKIEKASNE